MKTVAIHQPNFFPWLGYFNKISQSDIFILLDDAQMQKTGGSWVNRVKIMINGRPSWMTVPLRRNFHGVSLIRDIQINDDLPWRKKLARTLQVQYANAPHFKEVMDFIMPLIHFKSTRIAELNIHAIESLMEKLGLSVSKLRLASDFNLQSTGTDRLVSLVQHVGGAVYLSGGGAAGYQEDEKYDQAHVTLRFQNYTCPPYPQGDVNPFVPGLSVLDGLMQVGFEEVRLLIDAQSK